MKTELEIAKFYVNQLDFETPLETSEAFDKCKTHKATCERWLEFLDREDDMYCSLDFNKMEIDMEYWDRRLKEKIKDLKETIKFYEENGI